MRRWGGSSCCLFRIPQRCYVRWLDWFVRAGCWPFRSRRGLLFLLSLRRSRFGPRWFHRFEVFARSGVHTEIGPDLYRIFQEIGLPAPNVFIETPLGSDPAFTELSVKFLIACGPWLSSTKSRWTRWVTSVRFRTGCRLRWRLRRRLGDTGQFLIKDLVLLGASFWISAEALGAAGRRVNQPI
jgi:hypothetical protein